MKITKVEISNGGKGFWILPFLGFDWVTGSIRFWCGWIYWMFEIELISKEGK
jgi:hypothetical protein